MLGELTWEQQFDGTLNLSAGQRSFSVISYQLARLKCQSIKGVIDEGVHDVHGFLGDPDLWVDLLQHLVDVKRECLHPSFMSCGYSCSSSADGFGSFPWGHCIY